MERFIKNLAKGAGAILREGFGTKYKRSFKNGTKWNLVTEYDLLSEKFIIDRIRKKYPTHGILSEEAGHIIKRNDFWIIDPLAGTASFSRGAPGFSVSLAFVKNNQLQFGTVYDPLEDELFYGRVGEGATLNGQKIHLGQAKNLEFTRVSLQPGWVRETDREVRKMFGMVIKYRQWPVNTGSAALALSYVAAGRFDRLSFGTSFPVG